MLKNNLYYRYYGSSIMECHFWGRSKWPGGWESRLCAELSLTLVLGRLTGRPLMNSVSACPLLWMSPSRIILGIQGGYMTQRYLPCFCFSGNIRDLLRRLDFILYFFWGGGFVLWTGYDVRWSCTESDFFIFYFAFIVKTKENKTNQWLFYGCSTNGCYSSI